MPLRFPTPEFLDTLSERTTPLQMEFLVAGTRVEHLSELDLPEIAVVGRSNVGKSSLINYIAGRKALARVSHTPGRTQTINLFGVEKDAFIIADLPGYGFAQTSKDVQKEWQKGMAGYFSQRTGLIGVLFLVDIRRDIREEDIGLCRWFQELNLAVLGVQTKCDKIHKSQWARVRESQGKILGVPPGMMVSTSTQAKVGLEGICRAMAGILHGAKS